MNSSVLQKDVLRLGTTQFATLLTAYLECAEDIKSIINRMVQIIADETIPEDERAHATDVVVEALFPGLMEDVRQNDIDRLQHAESVAEINRIKEEEGGFADRLKRVMSDRGLTQEDLARKTGVGQPAISNMINRRCRPQRKTIERLALALDISVDDLWPTE